MFTHFNKIDPTNVAKCEAIFKQQEELRIARAAAEAEKNNSK